MQQRWREFWKIGLRKSILSAVTWTPGVAAALLLWDLPEFTGWSSFSSRVIQVLIYSYSIWLWLSVVSFVAWAYITWANDPTLLSKTRRMWFHILNSFAGVILGLSLAYEIDFQILENPKPNFASYYRDTGLGLLIAASIIFVIGYLQRKKETEKLLRLNTEAKYDALKAQMHPHFLFNSLNSLLTLIESKSDQAEVMTQKLSDLYREILASSSQECHSLKQELAIVESYLEIESFRLGERLSYNIDINLDAISGLDVPSLLVQTLVENAIKHGIAPSVTGGSVHIKGHFNENSFQLMIVNTGAILPEKIQQGRGLGITIERLNLRWGSMHNFTIERGPNETTAVSFRIPIQGRKLNDQKI